MAPQLSKLRSHCGAGECIEHLLECLSATIHRDANGARPYFPLGLDHSISHDFHPQSSVVLFSRERAGRCRFRVEAFPLFATRPGE